MVSNYLVIKLFANILLPQKWLWGNYNKELCKKQQEIKVED